MRGDQYVTLRKTGRDLESLQSILDRLITAKDHASVQISIADVDANGVAQSTSTTFAISGPVRSNGEGDDSINRLATQAGCECLFCKMLRYMMLIARFCSAPQRLVLSKVN